MTLDIHDKNGYRQTLDFEMVLSRDDVFSMFGRLYVVLTVEFRDDRPIANEVPSKRFMKPTRVHIRQMNWWQDGLGFRRLFG